MLFDKGLKVARDYGEENVKARLSVALEKLMRRRA
jgi:hypothetical protein